MSLSLTERLKQQKVLLDAGMITQEVYDQRVRTLQGQAQAAPPATQARPGHNAPPRAQTARRPEAGHYARAPYRFVPYDSEALVPAEQETRDGNIHQPKVDGLSAEIVVQWEAEGPLLVGQETTDTNGRPVQNGIVTPMRWAQQAEAGYFIPGSTLRGAIRSVAEIIGGGRLAKAHVNLNQVFALRDFTHRAYSNSREDIGSEEGNFPLADMSKLKAGWLRLKEPSKSSDLAMLDSVFEIVPAPAWYRVAAADIWQAERPSTHVGTPQDFTKKLSLLEKYSSIRLSKYVNGKEVPATASKVREFAFTSKADGIVAVQKGGPVKGHYAFSGNSPAKDGKVYEYVIAAGEAGPAVTINKPIWQRFVRAHSQAVKDKLKPDGAWKDIPAMFQADPALMLPVFYVGELSETQDPASFAFGITRLFKVPHRRTLEDVLVASGASDPVQGAEGAKWVDPRQLDIVDALFGFVYEGKEKGAAWAQRPSDIARKGRVAFSAAELVAGRAQPTQPVETIMMAPRPSFAPFYLTGRYKDYSAPKDEALTIAGRKRYPVRQAQGVTAQAAFKSVKERLTGQIEAFKDMNPQRRAPGPDVTTRLQFLLPQDGTTQNLVFESRIRLHNVTPVELGLVLDAVTLGGKAHLRHAIGRAKPFGAGQVRATVVGLAIEWNKRAGIERLDAAAQAGFLQAWQAYRDGQLSGKGNAATNYAAMRETFEACCNPEVGAGLDRRKLLDYLRLRELPQGANRGENPYQKLRDWVKPMKNAAAPTAPDGLLTIK